ncbi:MAG: arginine--tRNA ligase [Deltaproteobacteria bacterium RBG_13_52_11]|nr:MAG: arginine--tRNA ligase [Deltaproteobacteria bacterium RBG_13_52_11]
MKKGLTEIIMRAIARGQERGELAEGALPPPIVEYPREEGHGDYATNIAMAMASLADKVPRAIAETIVRCIEDDEGIIERVEVAGPGFINFFLKEAYWQHLLREADRKGERYGEGDLGRGKRALVEFLSANPTGPLHIGHGRIAAFGDALANLLEKVGYEVEREYYINDRGTQMQLLGRSVYLRYLQAWKREVAFPPDGYQGEYINNIAHDIKKEEGDRYLVTPEEDAISPMGEKAAQIILGWIKNDLEWFLVHFDRWYRETDLYNGGFASRLLEELRGKGYLYEDGGALWFKSTVFGDEKDRVVIRANNATTYFASDIAYHKDKYDRGYDLLIDIWGADHHGYIPRMEAAIQALGYDKSSFKVILVQLVNLLRGGKQVSMSTRTGEFTSLREVMDEVGVDACRYFFMLRRADSPLDFDLELAKREGAENPVYYVQYVHARIASIFKKAAEDGVEVPTFEDVDISLLRLPEERLLAKRIAIYPEFLEGMALALEPHRLTSYLQDLAGIFHSYYNKHRVISDDREMTNARFLLVKVIQGVVHSALGLLGIAAPAEM